MFPHELARDVLDADLRWRDPGGYKALFRRVRGHTYAALKASRAREQQRAAFDLKFIFRNLPSVLSPVDWDTWGLSYPEPAGPGDRARVLALVAAAEGGEAAAIAARWLDRQPAGVFVVRGADDDVRGVLALLDLTAATEPDRRADPGAQAAWDYAHRCAPPRAGEVVTQTRLVVDRDAYQGPSPTMNAAPVATLQRYLATPRLGVGLPHPARAGAVGRLLRPRRPAAGARRRLPGRRAPLRALRARLPPRPGGRADGAVDGAGPGPGRLPAAGGA